MKVLLVQPPAHSSMGLQAFMLLEPLGLETIAGNLIKDHEVKILDMRLDPGLLRELSAFRPHVVGVSSAFTADVYGVYRILQIVRDHNPQVKTFVGGQHSTMVHADFSSRADAVVLGEGEFTVPYLLNSWEEGRSLRHVHGLAFRDGANWVLTEPRSLLQNLDETPIPARSLTTKYLEHYFIGDRRPCASLEVSRGCPYRCRFCAVWRFYHGSYRSRGPLRVARELAQIKAEYVFFTDDNALAQPAWTNDLLEQIRGLGLRKHYLAQMRADSIVKHRDLLIEWKDLGLDAVFVGFESVSQRGLDEFNKRLTVKAIQEAIDTLRELNIWLMGSFVVSPDFSIEDFAELRQFVGQMKLSTPVFSILTPLPGTVLSEEKAEEVTSSNYELYDLMHSVLPTRLGLQKFYSEFMHLNLSYFSSVNPAEMLKNPSLHKLAALFRGLFTILKIFKNNRPAITVSHHRLEPGELTARHFPKQATVN
jgi:hopanoid C-3 methylase